LLSLRASPVTFDVLQGQHLGRMNLPLSGFSLVRAFALKSILKRFEAGAPKGGPSNHDERQGCESHLLSMLRLSRQAFWSDARFFMCSRSSQYCPRICFKLCFSKLMMSSQRCNNPSAPCGHSLCPTRIMMGSLVTVCHKVSGTL
jgi:hypothetical protein